MLNSLIKPVIKDLKPYAPNEYEYRYKLDANESPFNISQNVVDKIAEGIKNLDFNRYPDTNSTELRRELSKYVGVNYNSIVVGNGSDEMISVVIDTFVNKDDVVMSHAPTFVMYKMTSIISGAKYLEVQTDDSFTINIDDLIYTANSKKAKLIFLCTPNNPTGNTIRKEDIVRVINETNAIVVVDEAYIEFGGESIVKEVNNFDRLIVLRTLSKAFGAAGIRTGYLVSCEQIVRKLNSVKAPYNLNSIAQLIAIELLKNKQEMFRNVRYINNQRELLIDAVKKIKGVDVYSSEANFIIIRVKNSSKVFEHLLNKGIMIRNLNGSGLSNYLRVTVGSEQENKAFILALKEVLDI